MGRKRKRYTPEQIVAKLREFETLQAQGKTAAEAIREIGVSEPTFYRWRKQYGRMEKAELKRLRELEKENTPLKKLVADLSLDKAILKEALEGKP